MSHPDYFDPEAASRQEGYGEGWDTGYEAGKASAEKYAAIREAKLVKALEKIAAKGGNVGASELRRIARAALPKPAPAPTCDASLKAGEESR